MVSSCLFSFLNRCLASISSGASRRRRGRGRRPSHRAPARPRCRGVAHLRYAWTLGGAVSSSRCSTTRNPSSSWCSTFPEKALRVCLGRTSISSSAVPGCSTPALRLDLGRDCVVEPVLDNPKPFIELVLDVPGGGRSEFAWEGRIWSPPSLQGI